VVITEIAFLGYLSGTLGCYVQGTCFPWFLFERCMFFLGFMCYGCVFVLDSISKGVYISLFQCGCSQSLATPWRSCRRILT